MPRTVILLVDDEKTVLDSLGAQLERMFGDACDCEVAESADEAWEVLEEVDGAGPKVIVVVSDWLMPGQRGDEFLAAVRAKFPRIGRILLTGHADTAALDHARDVAKVHSILFKPWQADVLRDAIAEAMRAPEQP
jgi:CheY-like chemotaxis protein